MKNSGILERARIAREAQAELHAAFAHVVRRNDEADPRTRRWLDAICRFNAAISEVYPLWMNSPLRQAHTVDLLDFLEADLMCFRSGYVKGELLEEIKKRSLDRNETRRLQDVVLAVARHRDDREFRRYCHAAAYVDNERLRGELSDMLHHEDVGAQRRARWMIDALNHARRTKSGLARSKIRSAKS